jgi:hypothetical protein
MELDLKYKCTTDLNELSPLLELAMSEFKKIFMKTGELEAHFGFECDTEEAEIQSVPHAGIFLQSQEMKQALGSILRGFAAHLKEDGKEPMVCFSACEAWQSAPIEENDDETVKRITENGVADEFDKKEVLIFNFENKTHVRMISYEIIRGEGDDFVVSPNSMIDEISEKEAGKFVTRFQVWVDGEIYNDGNNLGFEFETPGEDEG